MSKGRMNNDEMTMVDDYVAQIKKTPLLSAEEELALARKVKSGDMAARNKLVNANLRLVVKLAYTYLNGELSLMDLIQEGNVGLLRAAEKYDDTRSVRFATYASWWIKQSIGRFLECKRRVIRIPIRKEEQLRRIKYVYNYLTQKLARIPTEAEIAEEAGIDAKEVRCILELTGEIVPFESDFFNADLDSLVSKDDVYAYSPEINYMREFSREGAVNFLNKRLPERERKVLLYRFEFNGSQEPRTFEKIGETIGVSAEAVRQIELRALRKVRNNVDEYTQCLYA